MYSFKSALKIISYILISIVLMLFFAFVLTYNFEKYPSDKEISIDELKAEMKEKVNEASQNINEFNEIDIKLGNKITNDLLLYSLSFYTNSASYKTEYWDLNKVTFTIEDRKFCVTLYADFHEDISYSLKIRAYFDVTYKNNQFEFDFSKFKLGAITIPDKIVSRILNKKDVNTIGYLVNEAINKFEIVDFVSDDLKIIIKEESLLDSIKNGQIGSFIFDEKNILETSGFLYLSYLFKNNLIDISVDDGVNVKVNVSKIKNINNHFDNYQNVIDSIKQYKQIDLTDIGSIFRYNNSKFYNADSMIINFKDSNIIKDENNLYLVLNYQFINIDSSLVYKFEENNSKYYLKSVTIGKDSGENIYGYLNIDLNDSYKIIKILNIDINESTNELNVPSLFFVEGLTLDSYEITSSGVKLRYQESVS